MNLALRRFEIVAVLLVAALCAYIGAVWYFAPSGGIAGLLLLPQPQVLNEKQAVLHAVVHNSAPSGSGAAISEEERLRALGDLENATPPSSTQESLPTDQERLDILRQMSQVR